MSLKWWLTYSNTLRGNWYHVAVLVLLAVNAGFTLMFWTCRLQRVRSEAWQARVLTIGKAARLVAVASLVALAAVALLALGILPRAAVGAPPVDATLWILWLWTVLELVHGHLYRLTFGQSGTLEHAVRLRTREAILEPVGGAIGRQTRKLSRPRAGIAQASRCP